MKKEEFIPNTCYTYKSSSEWVSRFAKWEDDMMVVHVGSLAVDTGQFYSGTSWGSYDNIREIRPSTPEEIQWLDDCIREDTGKSRKAPPRREIQPINYSIY